MTQRLRISDHLQAISDRLDRLDGRLERLDGRLDRLDAKVDRGFATVDKRFATVDERFVTVEVRFAEVHGRFDEERARTDALFEVSRENFNNLYDFVKAQAESTDGRFAQAESENRIRFADLQSAIAALAPRVRKARGRR